MEFDSCYVNEGVVRRISNKIVELSNKMGKSIGVDAPIGYGKSEVAKAVVDYFEKNKSDKIIPIYIKCDKYDFDVSLENTISACIKPIIDNIKNRDESHVNWKEIQGALEDIGKIIIKLDPKIKIMIKSSKRIFNANKPTDFENEKIKQMKELTNNINKLLLKDEHYIFIFDNLDICNPSFSLKMFDTIKYILSDLERKVNFLIFIDFEYLTLLHEGLFAKNVSLQYYYRQMFDHIIKMDLRKRSDFFEDKISEKIKAFYDYDYELKEMFISINERNKIPLRSLEITINELDNLIKKNPFYLQNNNLWILHTLYSFIVMNVVYIKRFNKIVYDNIGTNEDIIDEKIAFNQPEYYDLFFSNKTFIKGKLKYFDGYSSVDFDYENTDFKEENDKILIIEKDSNLKLDSVPIESFCFSGYLNLERSEEFVGIFTYNEIKEYDLLKLQNMTFRDYVRFKINNNY